jgi:hypothetical protein
VSRRLKKYEEEVRMPGVNPERILTLHLGQALVYQNCVGMTIDAEPPAHEESICIYADTIFSNGPHGPAPGGEPLVPLFVGKASNPLTANPNDSIYCLDPGDYLFAQWRSKDYPKPETGLTAFARHMWRDGKRGEGPWILRIVVEDGKIGYQGLRRILKT